MAAIQIDYNRGVIKRIEPKTGVNVFMYRDEPGVYLNAYGTQVNEDLAKLAGFNIERYGKERLKKERMATAKAAIEAELAAESGTRTIVKEREGFKIIDIGLERHHVEDPDGNTLSTVPMALASAENLLDQLVPEKPKKTAKSKE